MLGNPLFRRLKCIAITSNFILNRTRAKIKALMMIWLASIRDYGSAYARLNADRGARLNACVVWPVAKPNVVQPLTTNGEIEGRYNIDA